MRTWALALALIACDDPELDLAFEVPPAYRDQLASVQLRLLRPPPALPFDCEALAFGEVGQDSLRSSLERQVGVLPGEEAPLGALDRRSPTVALAEGLDASGTAIVIGCLEVVEVTDRRPRVIRGEPVAALSLAAGATLAVDQGAALSAEARVVDRLGNRLAEVAVRWTVVARDDLGRHVHGVTDGDGRARLDAEAPLAPGPFRLVARPRWGAAADVGGFVRPQPERLPFDGQVLDARVGRVGPGGEPGVVALMGPEGQARLNRWYRRADGSAGSTSSDPIAGDAPTLGLVERPNQASDLPIVLTTAAWWEMGPTGAVRQRPGYQPPMVQGGDEDPPQRLIGFTPCGGGDPEVLVVYRSGFTDVHGEDGGLLVGFREPLFAVAAGCVANNRGPEARTMVVAQPADPLQLVVEYGPNQFWVRDWLALPAGASFSPPVGGGPRLLIGAQLDRNDVVLSRARVAADSDRFELIDEGIDRPPSLPLETASGDLDGDRRLDVVALVRRPRGERFGLFAALAGPPERGRLTGDVDLPSGLAAPRLFVLDLDGDGSDDILVVGRGAAGSAWLYPMGLPR